MHLAVVYVVWGSTYLAIRVAVREGSGFPPFAMAAMRVFAAAAILFVWAALARHRLRLTRGELVILAGTGVLLWTGGNGLVTWGEQRADSGLAALLVASMPIGAATMEAILDRRRPGRTLVAALLAGFAGVTVLSVPVLRSGTAADVGAVVALLAAPITWSMGSIWMQRRRPDLTVQVASAYQHLFGGLVFVLLSLILREPRPEPVPEAWLAWGYLVVFGSVLAFTSYIYALRLLPLNVIMTYAYANPVIAVVLGWLILHERITPWTLAGAALVIAGVAGVFQERRVRERRRREGAAAAQAADAARAANATEVAADPRAPRVAGST